MSCLLTKPPQMAASVAPHRAPPEYRYCRKATRSAAGTSDPRVEAAHTRARKAPMSQLLARLARTLSSHWKRSLAAAVGVLVLLVLAAGAGGEAADDYSLPGAESQQAIDLFQAHSPAFGGADSTLVFTVDEGKVSDPDPRRRSRARSRRSASSTASSLPRARSSRAARSRRTAAWHRLTCATPGSPGRSRRRTARR